MKLWVASVREPHDGSKPYLKFTEEVDALPAEANAVSTIEISERSFCNLFDVLAGLNMFDIITSK